MDQEVLHTIQVLEDTKRGLLEGDSLKLKELSNETLHSACGIQDSASLTIAVLVYALSKIIERKDGVKVRDWDLFVKKFNSFLDLAVKALKENKMDRMEDYIMMARKSLTGLGSIKHYVQEVLKKASINKASKIYEHGISLGHTADLLGLTQWELAEYTSQSNAAENEQNITIDVKKRAKMALEFFS